MFATHMEKVCMENVALDDSELVGHHKVYISIGLLDALLNLIFLEFGNGQLIHIFLY